MSRFEQIAKSRARGAGLLESWRASGRGSTGDGVSRREVLTKAGLVTGAAIVSSSVIQSVTAPAFASSHVCTNAVDTQRGCGSTCGTATCPVGRDCVISADCASGVCLGGTCKVPFHDPCVGEGNVARDANCESGYCSYTGTCEYENTMKRTGESCHASPPSSTARQCDQSRLLVCSSPVDGVCVGLPGASCSSGTDCLSGVCTAGTGPFGVCA